MPDAPILEPGSTCWRIELAERLRVIFDGAEYFRSAKRAMLNARRTIMMIGWDFDTRIEFEPEGATMEGPNALGPFLKWMTKNRADVDLYMLKWDLGTFQALGRGMAPMAIRPIRTAANFHFKFDTEHPSGAAHHSKIIVVDDRIAFCGGIDITAGRWDTSEHLDDQPHRHMPGESASSKPWHDVTTVASGPVAKALGDLARERWFRATGERLAAPATTETLWPGLDPTFTDVPIAIARTYPDHNAHPEVREIEALYLRAIGAARRTVYIETQYLASATIARAIAQRLSEPDGPEFVVILPETAEGWLRAKVMDGARRKLLRFLWANDPHERFSAYHPVAARGTPIYVHAKVLIVDDRLLRIGSSNLNNRSMGFDTECDVAIEAAACGDPDAIAQTILGLRDALVAEHLSVDRATLRSSIAEAGFTGAIETLRGQGKTLDPFTRAEVSDDDSVIAENSLADPEGVEGGLGERLAEGFRDLIREWRG
jgi:phosphatidylserine/phosphatidylglycerophosphate/cardiolipin synthase-like enzyme